MNKSTAKNTTELNNFDLIAGTDLRYKVAIRKSYLTGEPIGIRIRRYEKGKSVQALQYDLKSSLSPAIYADAQERLITAAEHLRRRRLLLTGMRMLHRLATEHLCDRFALEALS